MAAVVVATGIALVVHNRVVVASESRQLYRVTQTIRWGANPNWVTITPGGGRALVTNGGSTIHTGDTVSVIDLHTDRVTHTIRVGANPNWVTITPGGGRALVTNMGGNTVSVITIGEPAWWRQWLF